MQVGQHGAARPYPLDPSKRVGNRKMGRMRTPAQRVNDPDIEATERGDRGVRQVDEIARIGQPRDPEAKGVDVAMRLERYPDAVAEDMEGFGVAVACYFGGVPLQIIRGISNRAGDRDKRNWDIDGALHAAGELTSKAILA